MVGKLYIGPKSSTEKLLAVTDLVAEAIDAKIATDAATRNALSKLHQALIKFLGDVRSVKPSIEDQGVDETQADNGVRPEDVSDTEETRMEVDENHVVAEAQDTLLEELLDDEDEDL